MIIKKEPYTVANGACSILRYVEIQVKKFGIKILNEKNQNPYELGLKAINSYLIRKFALDEKLLDSYELKNILKNNISDSLLERTINVLRSCEEYKYGGSDVKFLDDDIRAEMERIMKNIDKQIK